MMKKALLWSVMALVALSSCQDEFIKNPDKPNDKIGYSVVTSEISSPKKARSAQTDETRSVEIEPLNQTLGGKPLYLHTITDRVVPMDIKADKKKTDSKNAQSRAAETIADGIANIGVTSVVWNGDEWGDATDHRVYMDNLEVLKSAGFQTNYYWPAAEDYIRFFAYSPKAAGEIECNDKPIDAGESMDNKLITIDYIVPEDAPGQHDLLVASSSYAGNYKETADLNFAHALTAVQFKLAAGLTGVTVTGVRIKGVKYKGTYTYNYCGRNSDDGDDSNNPDTDNGTWEVYDDIYAGDEGKGFEITGLTETAEQLYDAEVKEDDELGIINYGANTFMMMPQVLPEGATIEVVVEDNNAGDSAEPQTLSAEIAGKVWQKGTKVIYTVSFNTYDEKYVIQISDGSNNGTFASTLNAGPFEYTGGFGNYSIRSYKITTQLGKAPKCEAIKWAVGTKSGVDILTGDSGEGVTSESASEGVFDFYVVSGVESTSHTAGVEGNGLYGDMKYDSKTYKDTPVDLSRLSINNWDPIPRHTANCYVVRSPGYYRFPLVYGNGIKDENVNTNAFSTTVAQPGTLSGEIYKMESGVLKSTGSSASITPLVLSDFVDHYNGAGNITDAGNPIVSPWIEEQCAKYGGDEYEITKAEIVWQDAPCLVTDIKIRTFGTDKGETEDRKFICFQVPYDAICSGNAVIALKNKNEKIMWSWHIWVAPIETVINSKPITNRRVLAGYNDADTDASNWTREESTFELMQSYLGYNIGETREYAERNCEVVFQQVDDEGNVILGAGSASLKFSVKGTTITYSDNCPTYQWGRKDPILPFYNNGSGMKDKCYYTKDRTTVCASDGNASDFYNSSQTAKEVSWTIAHPEKMAHGVENAAAGTSVTGGNWCNKLYLNLWNANCNKLPMFSYHRDVDAADFHSYFNEIVNIPVVKTIYDPCPAGYEMPRIDAFTGTTFTGTTTKPYITSYVKDDEFIFAAAANIASQEIKKLGSEYTSFSLGLITDPMRIKGSNVEVSVDKVYYLKGFGHRAVSDEGSKDGKVTGAQAQYASYVNVLTSGLTCLQWLDEHTSGNSGDLPYYLYSNRLCIIHGETNSTGGTLRPNSGSYMRLGFGVIPVKTGSNPAKTEVKVSGDIVDWVEAGDGIHIDF